MTVTQIIPYRLGFRIPVGVHTGLGVAGLIDRTVVRGADGVPLIPGSTVKGRVRYFAERLLRTDGSVTAGYSVHPAAGPFCKLPNKACTLCRLFGNPALAARVHFGNARPQERWVEPIRELVAASSNPVFYRDVEIRPGIAISRRLRTAQPDHLFFDETVPPIEFAGELRLAAGVKKKDLEFLRLAGRLVDALGSRKAVGRGALEAGVEIGGRQA